MRIGLSIISINIPAWFQGEFVQEQRPTNTCNPELWVAVGGSREPSASQDLSGVKANVDGGTEQPCCALQPHRPECRGKPQGAKRGRLPARHQAMRTPPSPPAVPPSPASLCGTCPLRGTTPRLGRPSPWPLPLARLATLRRSADAPPSPPPAAHDLTQPVRVQEGDFAPRDGDRCAANAPQRADSLSLRA
jgi:hypothetical protein